MRNSIHNTLSGVSMYCLIHHQGSRCINEYIVRGGVVLENVSSPLRFITKYIHFYLFNKVNVIDNQVCLPYVQVLIPRMNKYKLPVSVAACSAKAVVELTEEKRRYYMQGAGQAKSRDVLKKQIHTTYTTN